MERELEIIKELYIDKELSGIKIAKKLGYNSPQTIYNKLEKIGINRRGKKECQNPIIINKDELKYLYYKKDKTLNDIAIMKDVGEETVRRLMIKYGIDRKDKTRNFGGWNKGKEMSQEYKDNLSKIMKEKYQKGKIEHWNKGNHWDKDVREKISKSLLNGREPAPNYYGSDWQIQRTSCLQRDNYTCQQCGNKRNLEVHHWVPYRFSYNNRLCNLVTLCRDCHNFIHVMYKKEGFIYKNEEEFYGV